MTAKEVKVGVVGIGLMGSSISTCLLMAGHRVVGIAPLPADLQQGPGRIRKHLERSHKEGLTREKPASCMKRFTISDNYDDLKYCSIVIECTLEDLDIKKTVYQKIESVISPRAILTSNTSAIPITILQKQTMHPSRFFGLHWMVPAHTNPFLEIICGDLSDRKMGKSLYELAHHWGKEPIFVLKDIRGFITNRLNYALYREAFHLVEAGYASVEDVDRACRNGAGYWMTLVGPFRWMDLTGLPAYRSVMKDLFPTLCNDPGVPALIDNIVQADGRGILNGKGFYNYSEEEARLWEETYARFSFDIRKLAMRYPADVVKKNLASGKRRKKRKSNGHGKN